MMWRWHCTSGLQLPLTMTTAWKLVPAEEGKMQVPLLRAVMTATTLILMISPTTAALRRSWSWEWDSTCSLKHSIGFPHRPRFWWGLRNSPVIFAARLSTVTITCRWVIETAASSLQDPLNGGFMRIYSCDRPWRLTELRRTWSLIFFSFVFADAYVGPWIAVQERTRIAARHTTHSDSSASVLLLCTRMPQQYFAPSIQVTQGFPHAANSLQTEARNQTFHVSQMW